MLLDKSLSYNVRMALQDDIPMIVEIENGSFKNPLNATQVERMMHCRDQALLVFEQDHIVLGHIAYVFNRNLARIIRVAVTPDSHRRGVGRWLVKHVQRKAVRGRSIQADVPDTDLWAHLFFKACGFTCTGIVDEDLYRFVYQE